MIKGFWNSILKSNKKMKLNILIITFSVFVFTNCTNQISNNKNDERVINKKINYPITIELGAIGKGSNLPPTTFEINHDSVRISTRKKISVTEIQKFSITRKNTKFEELLSKLGTEDIKGDKHYFNPFIRYGGYMNISNEDGKRRFTNTFTRLADKSKIQPDTIGLSKFENISKYANLLMQEMGKYKRKPVCNTMYHSIG